MKLSKIYIDHAVSELPETARFLKTLNCPSEIVSGIQPLFESIALSQNPASAGKKILFLTDNKGPFLKECPGTSHYTCCNYRILHIGSYCSMDCSYCILQAYFHPPVLQYFMNHKKLFQELDQLFSTKKLYRIGTGEFTDSLIWEPMSNLTEKLVEAFSRQTSSILELKTKTVSIQSLKTFHHNRKTILSWSLNTESVIQSEERRTAPLEARLKAAALCESYGYPLAFHFDPLIIYEGCEKEYLSVIEKIFDYVSPDNIVWISMGSFRFIPTLKPIIQERFQDSKIVYGEFICGLDGKMRYFKPLRIRLYKKMVSLIRKISPDILVYFCMEDDEVWKKSLGFTPSEHVCGSLPRMLDQSAIQHCELNDFIQE
ncbi:MAG: DNA photolyase [Desulfobacteraceae bacterium]|nr:MAG: DNA photolyase [Desulfobacteraceae bacterium]